MIFWNKETDTHFGNISVQIGLKKWDTWEVSPVLNEEHIVVENFESIMDPKAKIVKIHDFDICDYINTNLQSQKVKSLLSDLYEKAENE